MGIKRKKIQSTNNTNIYRLLRIARDIKVKELAEMLGVTPAYINAIEKGDKIPSVQLRIGYSYALNVDEDLIVEFDEKSTQTRFEKLMLTLLEKVCKSDEEEERNES